MVITKHRWFSGRMLACHAGGPGSIPGRCNIFFHFRNKTFQSVLNRNVAYHNYFLFDMYLILYKIKYLNQWDIFDAYSYSDNIYPYIIHSLKEVRKFLHSFVLVLLSVLLSPLKSLFKGSNSLLSLWASWAWDYFLKKLCLKLFFSSFLCIVCKYVGKVPISKKRNVRLHLFLLYCTTTIKLLRHSIGH